MSSRSRHARSAGRKSLPYNENKGCPSGYHKRKSYLSLLGFRVPRRCIRSTSVYRNSSRQFRSKERAKDTRRNKLYIPSIKSLSRKVCPPGMIERKAFAREYSTAVRQKGYTVRRATGTTYRVYPKARAISVKPQCVKDTGKPGKGAKSPIGPLRKGELHKHGYSFKLKDDDRRKALRQAVKEFGPLGVYRKLNAVSKLSKSLAPQASNVFKSDRNWVSTKYGPLKAF
jgi:hypothetical protein